MYFTHLHAPFISLIYFQKVEKWFRNKTPKNNTGEGVPKKGNKEYFTIHNVVKKNPQRGDKQCH